MGLNVLVADRLDLRRSIALNTTCDGARRDVASSRRTVRPGEWTASARFLITATGGTGDPDIPDLACFDRFSGAVAHTLTWSEDLEDQGRLRGPVRGRPDDHGWRDRRRSRRFRPRAQSGGTTRSSRRPVGAGRVPLPVPDPGVPHRPGGQPVLRRLHRREDPRDRRESGDRGAAHPRGGCPACRRAPPVHRHPLVCDLQPRQCASRGPERAAAA